MIKASDIVADLHVHTLASGHAYSTAKECLNAATSAGLKWLAFTDHYFGEGDRLAMESEIDRLTLMDWQVCRNLNNIRTIGGAEFNIGHSVGPWDRLKNLKWKILSWHVDYMPVEFISNLDSLFTLYAASASRFDCLGHIDRYLGKMCDVESDILDYLEKLVNLSKATGTVLELNESSYIDYPEDCQSRALHWLQLAKEADLVISLGTGAHFCDLVGDFRTCIYLLNKVGFPKDRILNCNEDLLKERFG